MMIFSSTKPNLPDLSLVESELIVESSKKKVAVVTGSASGLGAALTKALMDAGYYVYATDINEAGLKAQFAKHDDKSLSLTTLDVRKEGDWQSLFADIQKQKGRVDLLLNVAGYLLPGKLEDASADQIDMHFEINVKGVILGCQQAIRLMKPKRSGHIINIASMASLAAVPGIGLYSASKFSVRAISLVLSNELEQTGIKVSVVCPDATQTPMLRLQEDYDEAALTFSGNKALTVDEVVRTIMEQVLVKRPIEFVLPSSRAWMARIGNLWPTLSFKVAAALKQKGLKEINKRRQNRV